MALLSARELSPSSLPLPEHNIQVDEGSSNRGDSDEGNHYYANRHNLGVPPPRPQDASSCVSLGDFLRLTREQLNFKWRDCELIEAGRAKVVLKGKFRNIKRMLILRAKIDKIRRVLLDGNVPEGQEYELKTAIRRFKVMYNSTGFCENQTAIRKKIGGVRDEDRMLKLDATTLECVTNCVSEVLNEGHLFFTEETSMLFDSCKVLQRVRLCGERRWVNMVEPEKWKETLDTEHSDHGHPGRSTFWPLIQSKFININRDVVKVFITLCRIKSQRWAPKALAAPRVIISRRVFGRVQVDLCTPQGIPQSSEFKVIFHLRCHFSRFSWAKPQRTKSMSETISNIREFCWTFEPPIIIQTDNGREFGADIYKLCDEFHEIQSIIHGRPRHPQTQGSIERANRTLLNKLANFLSNCDEESRRRWHIFLPKVLYSINHTVTSATKKTPAEVVFGRRSLAPTEVEDLLDSEFQYEDLAHSDLTEEVPEAFPNPEQNLESPEEATVEITEKSRNSSFDRDNGDGILPQANKNDGSEALENENCQQGRYSRDVLSSRSTGASGLSHIENELPESVSWSLRCSPKSCKQITYSSLAPLEEVTLTHNDHVFGWGIVKNNQELLHGRSWKDMVQTSSRFVVVIFKKAANHMKTKSILSKIYITG